MIITMSFDATADQVIRVKEKVDKLGYKTKVFTGEKKTVIHVIGVTEKEQLIKVVESLPGVESLIPILKPFKLASREFHPDDTVLSVDSKLIGKDEIAIIAGPQAAGLYGLKSIKEKIEDHPQNFTRFLIISGKKEIYTSDDAKTSLVFGVENAPGILFKCLSIFALRNIDLTKLESRPFVGKPWEYLFYIDFNGSIENENCKHAVDTLSEVVVYLKILGSYESKW